MDARPDIVDRHDAPPEARSGARAAQPRVVPFPPRYWWLKRIVIVSGVIVGWTVGLRLWWGWDAERRLNALIAEYRAAGEPIEPGDFNPPPVPDEENAAILWERAADAIVIADGVSVERLGYGRRYDMSVIISSPERIKENLADVGKIVNANAVALMHARAAAQRSEIAWPNRCDSPMFECLLPELAPQRDLAKLTKLNTLYLHFTANDRAAIESVRSMLKHANDVDEMPTTISHLVSISVAALATSSIEIMAPGLRIRSANYSNDAAGSPTDPEQVRELIRGLLDVSTMQRGWRRAMYSERAMVLDTAECMISHRLRIASMYSMSALARPASIEIMAIDLIHPMIERDVTESLPYLTDAARTPTDSYPAPAAALASPPIVRAGPTSLVRALSRAMLPSFNRALELHFRSIAERRMAAVALAMRLYEVDRGERPITLDALVPDYLDEVPQDPFVADGRPIGYVPISASPLLYCVGSDKVDDGGTFGFSGVTFVDPDVLDLAFFLNGERPRSMRSIATTGPASQQAENDNDVQDDDEGNAGQNDERADAP